MVSQEVARRRLGRVKERAMVAQVIVGVQRRSAEAVAEDEFT